jgi:light-harvesting complex I chlorophyll a/b binding protein 4
MALAARSSFTARVGAKAPRSSVRANAASRPLWRPGSTPPAHLNGELPGDFGFDPLGLGSNPDQLKWFAESERVHSRWAMLAVAGILAQEIARPDVFWYDAPTKVDLPFNIVGLLAFEFWAMQFVELKRWQDFKNPGSVDADPLFPNNKLAPHEVGYPGFAIFTPGPLEELKVKELKKWQDFRNPGSVDADPLFPNNKLAPHEVGYPGFAIFTPGPLEEMKVKEIKNGRLAMLAFIGFTMAAQVTGKNPIAALQEHLSDPWSTTIFSKAVVVPGQAVQPPCMIPQYTEFQGVKIFTPCLFQDLWP